MSFNGKTTLTISTKVRADASPQQTIVTIDWDGYTEEQAQADLMAGTSPRVAIQAKLREEGIPKTLEIKATDFHAKRARVNRPPTFAELLLLVGKMTDAEKAELAREAGNAG